MLYYVIAMITQLVIMLIWKEFWNEVDNRIITYSTNISNPVWWITYIMLVCFPFFTLTTLGVALFAM